MPSTAQGQPQTPDKRHCFMFQVVYASLFVEKEQRHLWNLHCRVFASVQLLGKGNPATLQSPPRGLGCETSHDSESEPELLSRLISICREGKWSKRLFFCLDCSFSLMRAPQTLCSSESSSSGDATEFSGFSGVFSCVFGADPNLVHKLPKQMKNKHLFLINQTGLRGRSQRTNS